MTEHFVTRQLSVIEKTKLYARWRRERKRFRQNVMLLCILYVGTTALVALLPVLF